MHNNSCMSLLFCPQKYRLCGVCVDRKSSRGGTIYSVRMIGPIDLLLYGMLIAAKRQESENVRTKRKYAT